MKNSFGTTKKSARFFFLIVIAAGILIFAGLLFFRDEPVLNDGEEYTIIAIFYSPEESPASSLVKMDDLNDRLTGTILDDLSNCSQRRSTELLFHRDTVGAATPSWLRLQVLISSDEEVFSILLGENGECQRRDRSFSPPVYHISNAEHLYERWMEQITVYE